jgi:glycosyltransferase involved in cell wall biosynthesis
MEEYGSISVIMPNLNNAKFIDKAIRSVLFQTYKPTELIVVDGGSQDESVEIIESFIRNGENLKFFETDEKGAGAARNLGIRNSQCDFVAFIDSDDIWLPTKLEKQVKAYHLISKPCVIYHDWIRIDENGRTLPPGKLKRPRKSGYVFDEFLQAAFGAVNMFLVPRRFIDDNHLFDPSLPWAEDLDFALKLASDYSFFYLDDNLYCYRSHSNAKRYTISRIQKLRCEAAIIERHYKKEKRILNPESRSHVEHLLASYFLKTHQYAKLFQLWFRSI